MGVRCVFKDSRDLLWIGTDAGLCTFDGKSFKIFKPSDGMSASQVWAIAEDEEGNMWFGSYGDGLYKYNGRQFRRFTHKDGLSDDEVRILCYSKNFHCLLVGSEKGLSTIKGETITTSPEEVYTEKIGGCITGIIDAGKFILITNYGHQNPVRYNPDTNEFVILNDQGKHYPDFSFSGFISSKGDTVLSLTTKGIRIFGKNGMIQNDTLGQVFGITEDNRGDLWIAAWSYQNVELSGGIFRYDGKTFKNFKESFGIKELQIWSVFYDRQQDLLWIGTETEGLFRVSFSYITYFSPSYFHLAEEQINELYVDSTNTLWISGNRELIKMKPDGSYSFFDKYPMISAFRRFWNDPGQKGVPRMGETSLTAKNTAERNIPEFIKKAELNFCQVWEGQDHFLFYTSEFGLHRYDSVTNKTDYFGQSGGPDPVALMGDTLIAGLWGATALMPLVQSNLIGYDYSLAPPPGLYRFFTKSGDPKDVSRIVKHDNSFWYTTKTSGLWMSKGMNMIHFNEQDSTLSNNVNDICFDIQNHVIFGTNTGEICIGTYADSRLKIDLKISSDNGLRGSSISWLVPDSNNNLWVGTNEGLNCIDLNELYSTGKYIIRFLDEESGYTGQPSKRAVIDARGNLWIAAGEQLIKVNTKSVLSAPQLWGKVILTSMEVDQIPADSLIKSGDFTLKYSENDLAFQFDILNYIDPGEDMFRYMLRGYDKNWREWGMDRKAVYTNLPPGNYVLCVESYNQRTLAKAKSVEFDFKIHHPWWRLWYIQALSAILFLILVTITIFKYVGNEKKKQQEEAELEKKMQQLQYLSIANQYNPHLTFNLFNTVAGFLHSSQMEEALKLTNSYAQLLRRTLLNNRSFKITFEEELAAVRDLLELEAISSEGSVTYDIQTSPDHSETWLPRSLLFLFVENAIKHGTRAQPESPQIRIKSHTEDSTLIIEVMDNGPGLTQHQGTKPGGTGSGFKIANEIIELYYFHSKQRISYEFLPAPNNSPKSFTVVIIRVPLVF
jgi:ligand-binding sensor domain-containing protein